MARVQQRLPDELGSVVDAGYVDPVSFTPAKHEALRSFVVLDSELVLSGLAALDGGAVDEILTTVTDDDLTHKGGHIGGRAAKAQAQRNRGRRVQEEMLRRRTEHSAAAALIDRLTEMDAIGVVDGALDEEVAAALEPGMAIRVKGDLSMHPLHQVDTVLRSFIKAAPAFGETGSVRELRDVLPVWNAMIGSGDSARTLFDLITTDPQLPRVVMPVKRAALQVSADEVAGFGTVLAKVDRIIAPEDQVLALRLLQNAAVSELERTAVEEAAVELIEGFTDLGIPCTPQDVVMSGPLVMLRPLCVWR